MMNKLQDQLVGCISVSESVVVAWGGMNRRMLREYGLPRTCAPLWVINIDQVAANRKTKDNDSLSITTFIKVSLLGSAPQRRYPWHPCIDGSTRVIAPSNDLAKRCTFMALPH